MASHCSIQSPFQSSLFLKSFGSKTKRVQGDPPKLLKLNKKELGDFLYSKKNVSLQLLFANYTSSRGAYLRALSSMDSSSAEETNDDSSPTTAIAETVEIEFNRVNCLVWVLHESATSFSQAVQSLELPGTNAELAMAWNGKDVHEWHRNISYQVAVYALLKMAIEVEILLSLDRHNNASPVKDILTPQINLMGEYIENELKMKHVELVQWFRVVELPRIAGFFTPLLKKWTMEYAGSGVAGIIVAISCCTAVGKLSSGKISCTLSTEDILVELMDLSHSLVEVNKLHQLATEAGFELDFLSHFGGKVLPCNEIEEVEFWIGLAQQKLSAAFLKESVAVKTENSLQKADSLATLGLFAYLGRNTRLFLSRMGVKDLDELVKDFLNYMECGILFTYPELASVSAYESFMEVVTDEIEWLDFYDAYFPMSNQERKRSKQYPIQAEKDIILSTVFTVCYDVFSGFAHFIRSAQQPLKEESLEFLLRSQSLLTVCLEDYQAVYARPCESHKIAEAGVSDRILSLGLKGTSKHSVALETHKKQRVEYEEVKLKKAGSSNMTSVITLADALSTATKSNFVHTSLIRRYRVKLASTSSDVWMGTQLLFEDIMNALELLMKQLKGHKVSRRERGKLKRTLNDIATLIPITILMLIPVSAVGHAAMLAGIKRYLPQLIPSPYSSERLDVAKQLSRTKKMEVQSWNNLQEPSSRINFNDQPSNPVVK
ncbi:LETM1-like protein [Euphorbia peplus]|nr:LETM1-like protein [Euphorbia peplus]